MSFHFTFILPSSLTALNALRITSDRFRLLFDPSLSSRFSIAELDLSTTDAPIVLHLSHAGNVRIRNMCVLDPSKGKSIKTTEDLISGSISAESISLECQHGAISGEYTTTVGDLSVVTSNFPITGSFTSRTTLHLSTTNNSLSGSFTSHALPSSSSGKPGLTIDTAQGRVEGTFYAPAGVRVQTKNAPISGEFTVAGGGEGVVIKTTYFKIDARITLLSPSTLRQPQQREEEAQRRGSVDTTSMVGSPTPSVMTYSEPPSFDHAVSTSSSGGGVSRVAVEAETTDGMVVLEYEKHPEDVKCRSEATTTGGAKIVVKHPEGWEGGFAVRSLLFLDVLGAELTFSFSFSFTFGRAGLHHPS